jgi:hypothetical protein
MKEWMFLLIVGLFSLSISEAAEPSRKSLNDVSFNLRGLQPEQTHKYKWVIVTQKGSKRESKDYGVLTTSTKLEKNTLLLCDMEWFSNVVLNTQKTICSARMKSP